MPTPLRHGSLDRFFRPSSVALIGATEQEGSVGRSILSNLTVAPFKGTVYAVNPKRSNVLGLPCYPHIGAVPGKVDLVVIATPARTVPAIVRECAEAKIKAAVIISAGFREAGERGRALEEEIHNASP